MRPPLTLRAAVPGRRRLTAAALALTALTAGTALAGPAHARDASRLFSVAGRVVVRDWNPWQRCEGPISGNRRLYNITGDNRALSLSFTQTCGDVKAEVYIIGRLRNDDWIDASGWVRVSEGSTELAYRPWAATFAPDFEQHVGPVTFGDTTRGNASFEWIMLNDGLHG
jgi:hypothetical protein